MKERVKWIKFLFGHTLQAVFITANSAVVTGTVKNSLVLRILLTTSAKKKHINNWKKKRLIIQKETTELINPGEQYVKKIYLKTSALEYKSTYHL